MLNRKMWYGLNVVTWLIGVPVILVCWNIAVFIHAHFGWSLIDREGDLTAFWMISVSLLLMWVNASEGSPEENMRKNALFGIASFMSVSFTQVSMLLLIMMLFFTWERGVLLAGLGGLLVDALVWRTLMRWLIRPPKLPS